VSWRVALSAAACFFSVLALACIVIDPVASGRLMAISAVMYGIVAISMFRGDE